jgi:hypothetical protein
MSHFNYRVTELNGELSIREVFYADDGSVKGWSEAPVTISGVSMEEIKIEIDRIKVAISKPVVDINNKNK